jgi:hypothetical protein
MIMNFIVKFAWAAIAFLPFFPASIFAQTLDAQFGSQIEVPSKPYLGASPEVALKPKPPTLTIRCTCDCGGTYHVVETLGASSCEDLSKRGRECIKDGRKHKLKDCGLRPTADVSAPFGDTPPVVAGESGGTAPGVAFAKTTVNCPSGGSFVISTGNASGSCQIKESDGKVTGGFCTDGANESTADCSKNSGKGACGNTAGSGECTVSK